MRTTILGIALALSATFAVAQQSIINDMESGGPLGRAMSTPPPSAYYDWRAPQVAIPPTQGKVYRNEDGVYEYRRSPQTPNNNDFTPQWQSGSRGTTYCNNQGLCYNTR